jgi:hypothetical protein
MSNRQLITVSRSGSFKSCRKRHWFEYEIKLRRITDSRALRMGSAYHVALDILKKTGILEDAIAAAREYYDLAPDEADAYEWEIERETVAALVSGYHWRWHGDNTRIIASEQSFRIPLTNPKTGSRSVLFDLAGQIDGIVELEDGRLAVLEHKLYSDDLNDDSAFWRRLQLDLQVSVYVHAARKLGYDVATVLYDVTRKPTIRPEKVPLRDTDGNKIVLDTNGERVMNANGKPRQTGDTEKGYVLQSSPQTPEQWSEKLVNDIGERPQFYYARREIPRLDQEIDECLDELWEIQQMIRDAQRNNRWYRTVSKDTCSYCAYFGLCSTKYDPKTSLVPEGFQYLSNPHPELELVGNDEAAITN